MVPSARVGHIGMYRDEETLEPHPYFCKMPKDVAERDVLIVDPMLATGGSAAEAIGEMKKRGCKHIKLMVLVAAPEGIEHIQKLYPDVEIYAGALDDHLNEHGYIVPRRRPRRKARSSVLRSKTLPQGESSACGFDPRRGFAPRIGAESRATAFSARSKHLTSQRCSSALRGRLLSQTAI